MTAPLGASEAIEYEQLAGVTFLEAVDAVRDGRLPALAAAAAVLIIARRDAPTLTLQHVLDRTGWYVQLLDAGTSAIAQLAADPPHTDGEG